MTKADTDRLNYLATCDAGFPAIDRLGDHDIAAPMLDADAEPGTAEMQRAFRDLVDRARADAKGKKK